MRFTISVDENQVSTAARSTGKLCIGVGNVDDKTSWNSLSSVGFYLSKFAIKSTFNENWWCLLSFQPEKICCSIDCLTVSLHRQFTRKGLYRSPSVSRDALISRNCEVLTRICKLYRNYDSIKWSSFASALYCFSVRQLSSLDVNTIKQYCPRHKWYILINYLTMIMS